MTGVEWIRIGTACKWQKIQIHFFFTWTIFGSMQKAAWWTVQLKGTEVPSICCFPTIINIWLSLHDWKWLFTYQPPNLYSIKTKEKRSEEWHILLSLRILSRSSTALLPASYTPNLDHAMWCLIQCSEKSCACENWKFTNLVKERIVTVT